MRLRDYHVSAVLCLGNLILASVVPDGRLAAFGFFAAGCLLIIAMDEYLNREREQMVMAWNAEPDGTVTGYMCMVGWECDIGAAIGGSRVFASVDDLKESLGCAAGCGIVEVAVSFKRLVLAGTDRP